MPHATRIRSPSPGGETTTIVGLSIRVTGVTSYASAAVTVYGPDQSIVLYSSVSKAPSWWAC